MQDGELDVNLFQHLIYLSQFNVENNGSLVPVGATAVYPLALYSEQYRDVKDLPEGANRGGDPQQRHQPRARPAQPADAGLLTLKDGGQCPLDPGRHRSTKVKLLPVDTNQR